MMNPSVAPPSAGYVFQQSSMVVSHPGQAPLRMNMTYESKDGRALQNELRLEREGHKAAVLHITDGVREGRPLAQKRLANQIQAYVADTAKGPAAKSAKGTASKKSKSAAKK